MVVDAVDALTVVPAYQEFVIASGDSDMTPLLVRLRAASRYTTIVSPSDAADAFTAVADRLIDAQQFLQLMQDDTDEVYDPPPSSITSDPETAAEEPSEPAARLGAFAQFHEAVNDRYAAAEAALNLASLAHELRAEFGKVIDETAWFGFGSFIGALRALSLDGMELSQHMMWDSTRHHPPSPTAAHAFSLPEPVGRLSSLLSLPRLRQEAWQPTYEVLADYASQHHFNLTEATRWGRDQLRENGYDVSRAAVGFVSRGAAFGGVPQYRQPPPTADEIARAFISNVLARAEAAGIELDKSEIETISQWLSHPGSASAN
jgi:hypothetical protein